MAVNFSFFPVNYSAEIVYKTKKAYHNLRKLNDDIMFYLFKQLILR